MRVSNIILLVASFGVMAVAASGAPLQIDRERSAVEVSVSSTVDSFVAHLDKYEAMIDCDPTVALPAKTHVDFNFADLKTGNKDRDAAMLKWLEYGSNATASFELTGWNQDGTNTVALGKMTIHGVTVALHMPVIVRHGESIWNISGQAVLDYRDFKLPKIRKALLLTVDPRLKVTFQLAGKIEPVK